MLVLISAIIGTPLFLIWVLAEIWLLWMYLLMLFSVMVILGGSASGNVYSSLGAEENKAPLSRWTCIHSRSAHSNHQIRISAGPSKNNFFQEANGMMIGSISGVDWFYFCVLCIQAKMTLPPFHIPEAETEIVEGPFIEYSGPPLGFWKLNHFMMYVVFPFLLILLFWGGFELHGIGFSGACLNIYW